MATSRCRSAPVTASSRCPDRDECAEVGKVQALVVTAIANLNDFRGKPLYSRKRPRQGHPRVRQGALSQDEDVTKFKVIYTLSNTGPLKKVAPPCPKKGVLGKGQEACVDYKNSKRRDGDLYLPFLYKVDGRMSS